MLAVMAGPFSLVPTAAGFQSITDDAADREADGCGGGLAALVRAVVTVYPAGYFIGRFAADQVG
ncbi:hypothetical protein GCM10023084_36770 [Streptomyces lacrimifluminis]|uniref:Uncharacterized protein n=1 Tax=Streptomyces lacrimifluminis TaxID=1500077 RepID=A0A917KZ70_9ACTN|nr:hypothetical protein GCM10012282_37180 [Streptomyces lacrimifluminis]